MSAIVRMSLVGRLRPEVFNALVGLAGLTLSRSQTEKVEPWGKLQEYAPPKDHAVDRSHFSRNLRLANARAQSQLRARRSSS